MYTAVVSDGDIFTRWTDRQTDRQYHLFDHIIIVF